MTTPTFVVGTGRCGSTMLSNMLREHPKVLSLSEFFTTVSEGARVSECFSYEPIHGQRFWELIAAKAPMLSFCLHHRLRYDECLYPCDDTSARFSRASGVPAIMATTLPHLTDEHDRLFVVLQEEVASWPEAPIREHYLRLFGWLAARFGKRKWIERSGASLGIVERLLELFPDARFIHIVRDGRDAAISMHKHEGFHLVYVMNWLQEFLGEDPLTSATRTHLDRVPAELRRFLPENYSDDAFSELPVPLPIWGEAWSRQVIGGLPLLNALSPERILTLRYEGFFADPKRQLDALAGFLGEDYVDENWSARCAATVRPPRSTWRDLSEEEACTLTEACRPGFELLREAGVEYDL